MSWGLGPWVPPFPMWNRTGGKATNSVKTFPCALSANKGFCKIQTFFLYWCEVDPSVHLKIKVTLVNEKSIRKPLSS